MNDRRRAFETAAEKAERDAAARKGELDKLVDEHMAWMGWKRRQDLANALQWSTSQLSKKLRPGGSITYREMLQVADVLRIRGARRRRFRELLGFPVDPDLEHPAGDPQKQHDEMLSLLKEMREQLARDLNRSGTPQPDWSLLAKTLLEMTDKLGLDVEANLSYIANALTILAPAQDRGAHVIRGRLHAEHLFWMVLKHLPQVAHHMAGVPGAAEIEGFSFRRAEIFAEEDVLDAMIAEGQQALELLEDAEDQSEVDSVVRFVGITMATAMDLKSGYGYEETTRDMNTFLAPFGLKFREVGNPVVGGGRFMERVEPAKGYKPPT